MVKHCIRTTSYLLALFTFLLIFQFLVVKQQQLPFNSTDRFELYVTELTLPKEEIISQINKIVENNDGSLVKVVTDSKEYENRKDIIWFGNNVPVSDDIVIKNNNVYWLDNNLVGTLISSDEIGSRPLYGTYALQGSEFYKNQISEWAEKNGFVISWYIPDNLFRVAYSYLIQNGIGNAILTAFLLFFITLIVWFISHAKSRAIRLLGGVTNKKIHVEDTLSIMLCVALGGVAALFTFAIYVGIVHGASQICLILPLCLKGLFFLFIFISIFVYLLSTIVSPKTKHLADRKIPLKNFRTLGLGARIISVFLALFIVPTTITSAHTLQQLSEEYSLWESMKRNVRVGFSYTDPLVTDEMIPNVEKLCDSMESDNNMSLSFVIDEAIALNEQEYGGYDHIIIADKSWIDSFDIGIEKEQRGGMLSKISFEDIASPLRDFLNIQMPVWTKTKTVQPEGVEYCEFSGESFLALPPNVAYGGSTIQAKNPLVVLVNNPIDVFDMSSFIVPTLTSGNIVFSDENILKAAIYASPIQEYVVSIDTISDVALDQAQKFSREAAYYIMASTLIFIAMAFAGVMEAQLWTDTNKKRIFTLRTFGKSYVNILIPPLKKELLISIVTIFLGAFLSFVLRRPDLFTLVYVTLAIGFIYIGSSFISYEICAKTVFNKTARRNE